MTTMKSRWAAVAAASAGFALPTILSGQMAGAGVAFESYTFDEPGAVGIETLSLMTVPLAATVNLFGGSSVTLSGAYASGRMVSADGSEIIIDGLTDTQLKIDIPISRDLLVISGIVALPTGTGTMTVDQSRAAGAFAADLLPFRVTSWGSGGAAGVAATLTRRAGDFGLGLSVGYSAAQEFTPLAEDERAYRPGNELNVRVALDRNFGRTGKASLQLGGQRYADDQLGGQNLYRSGDRYSAVGSYAFASGARSSGAIYAGIMHRTEGSFIDDPDTEIASQDLILTGAGLRLPLGGGILAPSVDGRVFRSTDGAGQGYVGGLGASYEIPMGEVRLIPAIRGRLGQVVANENAESGITGFDAAMTIRFGSRR